MKMAFTKKNWLILCLFSFSILGIEITEPQKIEVPRHANPKFVDPNVEITKEFKQFSEDVASRIDRVVKKKTLDLWGDPWTVQGIPLVFPGGQNGFNVGFKAQFQNIRRQDPHKLEVEAGALMSDAGRQKHNLRIDIPHFLDSSYRVSARVAYDRDITFRYFGIGNNTTVDFNRMEINDPLYQNTRSGPSFQFQILKQVTKQLSVGPSFGLKWTDITFPSGGLLSTQMPVGVGGGKTHYLGLVIFYNATDFEPYPSTGVMHEFYFNWYAPWVGSDYSFFRSTYTFKAFYPIRKNLILAHRTLFEILDGNIPFYELGAVGGSNPTIGIGGDKYFRGYHNNRFIDKIRLAVGLELRWEPFAFNFAKQDIVFGLVPFFDVGRVWPAVTPIDFTHFHGSIGWGARLIWSHRFVVRADVALNDEGGAVYVEIGNSF